jgi:hypothetical protein
MFTTILRSRTLRETVVAPLSERAGFGATDDAAA